MSTFRQPLTKEQLKGFKKDVLIDMVIALSGQLSDMNDKLDILTERINVLTDGQFGRQSEKKSVLDDILGPFFNEAEVIVAEADPKELVEPTGEDIKPKERTPHNKGRRENMLVNWKNRMFPLSLKVMNSSAATAAMNSSTWVRSLPRGSSSSRHPLS